MKVKTKWGGVRENAGRPLGSENKESHERRVAEQQMVQRIVDNLTGILNSQFNLAKGLSYLYRIDEDKKEHREHVLVEDPEEIKNYLDAQETGDKLDNYYYITTKSPDGRAIDSLIDRAFGKSRQQTDVNISGSLDLLGLLNNLNNDKSSEHKPDEEVPAVTDSVHPEDMGPNSATNKTGT